MKKNSTLNFYAFASLFLVLIIDTMGFGIIMPILPTLFHHTQLGILSPETSTQTRDFLFGLTMAIFFIFTFLGSPLLGNLSDQLGRKKVMLLCLVSVAAGYLISAFSILTKSIILLMLGRAISGIAAGSQPIGQAAIIDASTEKNKTINIGLISLAGCIGFIIGPIIGGYFASLLSSSLVGYSLPFFVAALLALFNSFALLLFFKETYTPTRHTHKLSIWEGLSSLKLFFVRKSMYFLALLYFCIQLSWSIYFQYTSLYLSQVFHYSPNKIGLFMAYLGIIFSISLSLIIRLVLGLMKLYHLILSSLILVIIGLIFTVWSKSELTLWYSVAPISIGIALSYASITSVFSSRVDKDSQGKIMGMVGSISSLAWVLGGLAMGVLTFYGANFPFLVCLSLIVITIILLILDARKNPY